MHILKLYFEVKEDPTAAFHPRVFILVPKPHQSLRKSIIKVINEVANLINHDETINDKIKVVFLENYNVSLAEKLFQQRMSVNKSHWPLRKRQGQAI